MNPRLVELLGFVSLFAVIVKVTWFMTGMLSSISPPRYLWRWLRWAITVAWWLFVHLRIWFWPAVLVNYTLLTLVNPQYWWICLFVFVDYLAWRVYNHRFMVVFAEKKWGDWDEDARQL